MDAEVNCGRGKRGEQEGGRGRKRQREEVE